MREIDLRTLRITIKVQLDGWAPPLVTLPHAALLCLLRRFPPPQMIPCSGLPPDRAARRPTTVLGSTRRRGIAAPLPTAGSRAAPACRARCPTCAASRG